MRPLLPIVGVIVELLSLLLVVVTKGGRELALPRSFQSLGYRSLAKSPH